ncbi:S8 family serine peptidase [Arthrobacter jiangjiafuii]|uniref:S8 family serine peptidase n=1 Tax=Arthrobacter jiangjiafuii TaxID=2817475 RepID=A0A975QZZ3_9MICC|nr:S8 family serine peptidase [Arthrobacter jiangjiafuii]MBP3044772.1 S8 family serine peptidase [Arthrobacter jiangjiafuii]QWC10400.1 S8 family serine peptidase [Arthrobacter jiangjiafuii]
MRRSIHHRSGAVVTAALAGLALTASLGVPAQATEGTTGDGLAAGVAVQKFATQKVSSSLREASGQVSVYVQFTGEGAFEQTQPEAVKEGKADPVLNQPLVEEIRSNISSQAESVAAEADASTLYTTTNTLPGVAIVGDAEAIRGLAGRADVARITKIVPKTIGNKGADIDTRALNTWVERKQTGKGITIAVLDTGIDYTHSDFGGPGTAEAYKAAQASPGIPAADSGLIDSAKFIGGYDLVGDDYDADPSSPTYQPVPKPDLNPLDCGGHGTHVAGTAAGYGTNGDGSTFRGDYSTLTAEQVNTMRIGPGSAPEAQLVGIRVFGCAGSSEVVGQALDYVLDPNGDGDFSDRAQVVNMSLGSDYAPADDPENDIVNKLTEQGILSVVASGNAGDVYDIGGSPGNAKSALTVASTIGSQVTLDRADVLAPADLAGSVAGQYSSSFNYADPALTPERLTGSVVMAPADNAFGCNAFPAGSLTGKWVWIQWEENNAFPCGSGVRFNNAQAAGATGVVLDSPRSVFDAGIGGNATIPGIQLNAASSDRLRPAAQAGTLTLRLDPSYRATATGPSGAGDTISSFSSRGLHGSNGVVKPDVAAPGSSIGSAAVGSGTGASVSSGTSMATPHVAGIAALVYAATDLNPYEVKTAIMNTATHDLLTAEGNVHAPNRVGSGRVDALDALNTKVLAYAADDQALTSVNFGVLELGKEALIQTKQVTVENKSDKPVSYDVSYLEASTMPGVVVSTTPKVSVPANGKATVDVTLSITDPAALAKTMDPAAAASQLGLARQFIADVSGRVQFAGAGTPTLRVPVYSAPKPTSEMTAGTEIAFADSEALKSTVTLQGRGLDQGTGASRYLSLVAPLVLGAQSPRLDSVKMDSMYAMDLQSVGASSTVPTLKAAGGDVQGAVVNFGVSTWANWPILGGATEIDVEIDTNGDSVPDFVTFTTRADDLDLVLASTYQLNADGTASMVDQTGANGLLGDTDSNPFDTNAVTLPVSAAALGLDLNAASAPLQYRVTTWSPYNVDDSGNSVPVDTTEYIPFDAANPALSFSGATPDALFADVEGGKLDVTRAAGTTDAKALFLHLHNATGDLSGANGDGGRAEVLPIKVPAKVVPPVTPASPVSAVSKCTADKAEIAVTVKNPGTRQANVEVTSEYGSAKTNQLKPGESKTVVIKTKESSIKAGEVTVNFTYTGKGKPEKASYKAAFDAQDCGKPGKGDDKPGNPGKGDDKPGKGDDKPDKLGKGDDKPGNPGKPGNGNG